jgi:hypothetical protein
MVKRTKTISEEGISQRPAMRTRMGTEPRKRFAISMESGPWMEGV